MSRIDVALRRFSNHPQSSDYRRNTSEVAQRFLPEKNLLDQQVSKSARV